MLLVKDKTSIGEVGHINLRLGLFGASAAFLFLSSCAGNCTGDPRFDSAACAAKDVFTGGYEKRTTELENQAAESQARAASLREENEKLNAKMKKLNRKEREAARRLRNSNEKLASLISKLSRARAENKTSAEEFKRLDAQLRDLEARHKAASRSPLDSSARAEIAKLEKDVQRLQRILDTG